MKKALAVSLCLLLLIAASVFASGGKEQKAEGPKKIVFWFPANNPKNDAYFNSLGPAFMKTHPEIEVETIVVPSDSAEIVQKLNTAKLAGTYPDVFSAFLIFIGTRGAKGEFLNIEDRFAAWDEKDDILPKTVEMGKYQGELIGLGFFPAPVLKVYRKDYYREVGLDPNQGPETWQQYWDQAKKATKYDGKGNIVRAGADVPTRDNAFVYTEPFMRQAGSMVIDEVNQKPAFTDKGAIEALQFITDMWNNKVSYPHDWVDFPNQPFINNRAAVGNPMVPTLMNMIKNNPDVEKELGYADVMQKEAGGERWAFCGYRFFVIGATTKYPDESWEFMKFMMSKDEMWKRYTELAIQPVRKSLEQQFIDVSPERNKILARHVSFGKGKSITPWTSISDRYTRVAYEEALNGIKTPEQALKDAEKGLMEEIAKMK
jgi:ABC-type glycerol-3-phosphate transport system substrate-binding protein